MELPHRIYRRALYGDAPVDRKRHPGDFHLSRNGQDSGFGEKIRLPIADGQVEMRVVRKAACGGLHEFLAPTGLYAFPRSGFQRDGRGDDVPVPHSGDGDHNQKKGEQQPEDVDELQRRLPSFVLLEMLLEKTFHRSDRPHYLDEEFRFVR